MKTDWYLYSSSTGYIDFGAVFNKWLVQVLEMKWIIPSQVHGLVSLFGSQLH